MKFKSTTYKNKHLNIMPGVNGLFTIEGYAFKNLQKVCVDAAGE